MGIKILWTDFALTQLEDIFDYYKVEASPSIARKLIKSIIKATLLLESNPLIGVKEPLLSDRPFDYRYLVQKNYKIIYRFNDNMVFVISIFDCRQNPEKIEMITE